MSNPKTQKAKSNKQEELQQQVEELTEALQRERADAVNLRRQHGEQIAALKNMVTTEVVEQLLPIIDHFELALKHVPKELTDDNFVKGISSIVNQFERTLSGIGVERIKTVGERFDPHLHEAVSAEEGAEIIGEEVQAGYKLGNQVIRHAKVKITSKKP